jgi:hypothetical protein
LVSRPNSAAYTSLSQPRTAKRISDFQFPFRLISYPSTRTKYGQFVWRSPRCGSRPSFAADRPEVHGEPEYKAGIYKINEALSLVSVSDPDWCIFVVSPKEWNVPLTEEHRALSQTVSP